MNTYKTVFWIIIAILLAFGGLLFLPNPIDHHLTASSFVASLLAGLIMLILGSFLIPLYLEWRQRPHLILKNRQTRDNTCHLTEVADGYGEGSFEFVIRNEGPTNQKHWYWHLLIPAELQPKLIPFGKTAEWPGEPLIEGDRSWMHYLGESTSPIFVGSGYIFPFIVKVKANTKIKTSYTINYYFSTEFGTWPRKAQNFQEIEEVPTRVLSPEYLGQILIL